MMATNKDFASMLQQGGFGNDPILALANSFHGLMDDVMAPSKDAKDIPTHLSNCFVGLAPSHGIGLAA